MFAFSDRLEQINERLICFPSFSTEAWQEVAKVVTLKRRALIDLSGQESSAQRTIGNEADSELFENGNTSASGVLVHNEYSF